MDKQKMAEIGLAATLALAVTGGAAWWLTRDESAAEWRNAAEDKHASFYSGYRYESDFAVCLSRTYNGQSYDFKGSSFIPVFSDDRAWMFRVGKRLGECDYNDGANAIHYRAALDALRQVFDPLLAQESGAHEKMRSFSATLAGLDVRSETPTATDMAEAFELTRVMYNFILPRKGDFEGGKESLERLKHLGGMFYEKMMLQDSFERMKSYEEEGVFQRAARLFEQQWEAAAVVERCGESNRLYATVDLGQLNLSYAPDVRFSYWGGQGCTGDRDYGSGGRSTIMITPAFSM